MLKKIHSFSFGFLKGYYTILLICLVLLFIFRPYDRSSFYLGGWKFILSLVFLSAIFNAKHLKCIKIIGCVLAVPSIIFSWLNLLHPMHTLFVANAFCTMLFMVVITASILYDVILRAKVTPETLRGVVCAYFMIAFAFAYTYYLIEFIQPGSFNFISDSSTFSYTQYLSELLYFSFVTLLTIGFGDITAIRDMGQTAVVIEGIIGQFYIAIIVARIVSVYSFYSDKRLLKTIESDLKIKKK